MSNVIKPLRTFYEKVDKRSKQSMVDFLKNHFRYNTMNSWNASTSYANNVKIHRVIPPELTDKVYEMYEADGFYDDINDLLNMWNEDNGYEWQAAFNGRSVGYIVLYQGYRKISQHKSVCTNCGQRNFTSVSETGTKCGRCGEQSRIDKQMYQTGCWPGRSTDMGEDFADWDISSLKARVELVSSFDRLCDEVVAAVIQMAADRTVVEETVYIPKTVKRIL